MRKLELLIPAGSLDVLKVWAEGEGKEFYKRGN